MEFEFHKFVELNQTPEKIQKIVKNIRKRAHYCVLQNGDLFEHLLKKKEFQEFEINQQNEE